MASLRFLRPPSRRHLVLHAGLQVRVRRGFTVVEFVVAATILAVIAAAVARSTVGLMQVNRVAMAQLAQSQATRRQAEAYRAIPFDSLDAANSPYKFAVNADGEINGPGAKDTLVVLIDVNPARPTFKRVQTFIIRY